MLYKKRIITDEGTKDIGKLLVYFILPCAIINSCNMEYSREKALGLLLSFLAAAAAFALSVIISRVFFRRTMPVESFGAAFSNAGFMGIPLVSSIIGSEAVYYAVAFVAVLNILQCTYGVYLITGNKSNGFREENCDKSRNAELCDRSDTVFPACKASCFRIRHTGKHIADERAYRYAHRGVLSCTGITEEAFFGRPQLCGLRCKIACYPSAYRGIACSPALR